MSRCHYGLGPIFCIVHNGLFYRMSSLPEGFAFSPQLFHWTLRKYLDKDMKKYKYFRYFDDIVLLGDCIEEIQIAFDVVLVACEKCGFRISEAKCRFSENSVTWLGYEIKGDGKISPSLNAEKIEGIIFDSKEYTLRDMQRLVGLFNRWKLQSKDVFGFSKVISDYEKRLITKDALIERWENVKKNLFHRYRFLSFPSFELYVDWWY